MTTYSLDYTNNFGHLNLNLIRVERVFYVLHLICATDAYKFFQKQTKPLTDRLKTK